jgi:hypothetical protein
MRKLSQTGFNRCTQPFLDIVGRDSAHLEGVSRSSMRVKWYISVRRAHVAFNKPRMHHQRTRRQEHRKRPIMHHDSIFALAINRENLIVTRMFFLSEPMSVPASAQRTLSRPGPLPKRVPVVHGIVVGTPGGSHVSRMAQTGAVTLCPDSFLVGGGINRE